MARVDWLGDVLRAAGVEVVEVHGWKDRGNGSLFADAVVWHHDGSPPGASPNVPGYIAREVDAGRAGANVWVGLDGRWHLIAAGRTFHAGKVRVGKPGNAQSIGIETDHTTGEPWSGVELLASLRKGTAAVLAHMGRDVTRLEFHKTVCDPPGRKHDPDGLDLFTEREAVDALMEDDMPLSDADVEKVARKVAALLMDDDHLGRVKHHIIGQADQGSRLARVAKKVGA